MHVCVLLKGNKMEEKDQHITDQDVAKPKKKVGKGKKIFSQAFYDVLGGEFLAQDWAVRQISFILFLAALALVYIANTYYTEATSRTIDRVNREIKELQYEYIYGKSAVMSESKQTEIARKLEKKGLKESVDPVGKIVVSKNKLP